MLIKRGKIYHVKVRHRGKYIWRSTGERSKKQAQEVEKCLVAELTRSRKSSGFTFADAALRWVDEKKHKKSIHSDLLILEWFAPRMESMYLSDITREVLDRLRTEKLSGCSTETVNRHMALLRAILNKAVEWEWIEKAPKVPMYPKVKARPRFLSSGQFMALVAELPSHLGSPAWFSYLTGLRATPVRLLQWDWISRSGISFPASVMKSGKPLTIPLSQDAWYVIAERWALLGRSADSPYVFATNTGQSFTEKFTTRAWRNACERAGIPGTRFHDLRHTWVYNHLRKQTPLYVIQKLGGWQSLDVLLSTYGHLDTKTLEEWV